VPERLAADSAATAGAFGWEWQTFERLHDDATYTQQFLDWIWPLDPGFFRGKVVLDAGCGMGRFALVASRFGAREVLAVDLSTAVEAAARNTAHLPNVHVIQADISRLPLRPAALDFSYTIGVLHHLPDPEAGFHALVRHLRPGGAIFAWVYGRENNTWLVRYVNPVRIGLSSRLPRPVLYLLAGALAAGLHPLVKLLYRGAGTGADEDARSLTPCGSATTNDRGGWRPTENAATPPRERTIRIHRGAAVRPASASLRRSWRRLLPYRDYLAWLAQYSFRHTHHVVFDHLVAPTACYLRRAEFEAWFRRAGLEHVRLSWRNRNSWRGYGEKPRIED
jgi:SAM-dependent methyltransferase